MINPLTIVQDINIAIETIEKLKSAIPSAQKLVADIKQASTDKGDPAKLYVDLDVILSDVNDDLTLLAGLFPSAPAPLIVKPA